MTYIIGQEKPSLDEALEHFGILGMHWGVRKEESTSATPRTKIDSPVKGLEKLPEPTAKAMASVADNMSQAYGFQIHEVIPLRKHNSMRAYAYVDLANTGVNTVHVSVDPKLEKSIKNCVDKGWFVQSGDHPMEALMTHEATHAIFHTADTTGMSRRQRAKAITEGQHIQKARDKAWKKAEEQALADGTATKPTGITKWFKADPQLQMRRKLSTYAASTIFIEESEAEMFASYHWNPNPPKFVDAFVSTVHQDLGYGNVPPFSGRKVP